jgi:flagellar basal-body rod protein FlgF
VNYGLYLSAAGLLSSLHRQDVLANNLANVATIGFKPDDVTARFRLPERLENPAPPVDPNVLLEQLTGGTSMSPTRTMFIQGDLAETTNDLDLAIQGDGFFVMHNGQSGTSVNEPLRFTRDGRLTLNSCGELVHVATGMRVMDVSDLPIRLDRHAKLAIDSDGTVRQNGAAVARIQVSTVADETQLVKEGGNVMRLAPNSAAPRRLPAAGAIRQGYVESSAVDPIAALNKMILTSKAIEANATMMQYHDNLLGQAVNTFGRVA